MIVLGFDTSTPATAVALRLADGRTTQARDDPQAGAHPGHATRLLEMARELLARAGIAWSGIDRIAVGVGPGTFTGLRVGRGHGARPGAVAVRRAGRGLEPAGARAGGARRRTAEVAAGSDGASAARCWP